MVQFSILREGSRAKSKITTLHFKRAYFPQFGDVLASVKEQQVGWSTR